MHQEKVPLQDKQIFLKRSSSEIFIGTSPDRFEIGTKGGETLIEDKKIMKN